MPFLYTPNNTFIKIDETAEPTIPTPVVPGAAAIELVYLAREEIVCYDYSEIGYIARGYPNRDKALKGCLRLYINSARN
jgi:hypothetical protein